MKDKHQWVLIAIKPDGNTERLQSNSLAKIIETRDKWLAADYKVHLTTTANSAGVKA